MSRDSVSKAPLGERQLLLRWGVVLAVSVSLLYGLTLQVDINGSSDRYAEDAGEFQNVLARWGTAHPTGYPLYALSGAAFSTVLRALGTAPAAAASAFSAFLSVLALLGVYALLCRWQVSPELAAGTTLLLATLFPVWIHATLAEVYALTIGLIVLACVIVARWQAGGDPRHLNWLAFVVGLGIGHHRLMLLALPALAIYAGPLLVSAVRERSSRVITASLYLLPSFLIYLYLPLRAWLGGDWVYGQPGTWDGFWSIVTAREYGRLVKPVSDLSATQASLGQVVDVLATGLTWPLLIAGAAGLVLALRDQNHRRVALAWIVLALMDTAFASVYSQAVFLPAALLPALLALAIGVGLLAQRLTRRAPAAKIVIAVALAAGAVVLIATNAPAVWAITRDPSGRELIERVAEAPIASEPDRPVVFALWGRDFFALAYAHGVTGELASIEVVDHRADVKALVDSGRALYVLASTFYYEQRALPWWDGRLGRAYLSSYAGNLVRVSDRPILTQADLPPGGQSAPMGASIALRAWQVEPLEADRAWQLTLYWQALSPIERDYSVFVHVTDRDDIDSPDDIVAQADSSAPVYGWYPTSRWAPGEIVRDDVVIRAPANRQARLVAVGLYYQDESGGFHNLGKQLIRLAK